MNEQRPDHDDAMAKVIADLEALITGFAQLSSSLSSIQHVLASLSVGMSMPDSANVAPGEDPADDLPSRPRMSTEDAISILGGADHLRSELDKLSQGHEDWKAIVQPVPPRRQRPIPGLPNNSGSDQWSNG